MRGTFARIVLVLLAKAFRRQTLFEWIAQSGHPGIVAPDRGDSAPGTSVALAADA
jgi:predicted RNase H-like nuclease (RuvC/YqgF family)